MPKIDRKLSDVYSTVSRPIALTMIRQISQLCGWDFDKDNVLFRGRALTQKLDATKEWGPQEVDNDVRGPSDGFTRIELQEQFEDQSSMYDTVFKNNSLPVFLDRNLGVSIVPAYGTTVATLNITRRFTDSVLAERWWNDMKRLTTHGHVAAYYVAEYSYDVPPQFLKLLREIWKLREAIAPYGDLFSEYLRAGFDRRATTFATVKGENEGRSVRMAIREMQENISGWFEFADAPKPEPIENSSAYEVSFSYRYSYEKPTHMVARYPIQIHQQVLPAEFLATPPPTHDAPQRVRRAGMSVQLQQKISSHVLPVAGRHMTVYRFPEQDEWMPPSAAETEEQTVTLFTALLSVDANEPNHLVSFQDLAEIGEFSTNLQTWFDQYRSWAIDKNKSPVFIELYKDNLRYSIDKWRLDDNLQFVTEDECNLRSSYRIRVALQQDLTKLQAETVEALCYHPDLILEVFEALQLPKKDMPVPSVTKRRFSYTQLITAIKALRYTPEWFRRSAFFAPRVLIGTIVGVKRKWH